MYVMKGDMADRLTPEKREKYLTAIGETAYSKAKKEVVKAEKSKKKKSEKKL